MGTSLYGRRTGPKLSAGGIPPAPAPIVFQVGHPLNALNACILHTLRGATNTYDIHHFWLTPKVLRILRNIA